MTTLAPNVPLHRAPRRAWLRGEARSRGVTLVEVLVTVAIVAFLSGTAVLGLGVAESARLKSSAVMIAGAARIAYSHASATSKTVRLVFDFDERTVSLEESNDDMLLSRDDRTGGAEGATDAEREAIEASEAIADGPKAPRAHFVPAKALGFASKDGNPAKSLGSGIRFLQIETAHQEDAQKDERAYLYFWPGGQTERAAIQIARGSSETIEKEDVLTILISPLTGKAQIEQGMLEMPRPRDDRDESEREDTGF